MQNDETIKTSVYMPRSLLKRLKDEAFASRSSVTGVVLEATETWLAWRSHREEKLAGLPTSEIETHRAQYFSSFGGAIEKDRRYEALKAEAQRRGVSVESLILQAVDTFVRSFCSESETNPEFDSANLREYSGVDPRPQIIQELEPWISYLRHILAENNPFAAPSIKKNLEAFARLTDLDGGINAPTPGEPSPDTDSPASTIRDIEESTSRAAATADELAKRRPHRRKAS